MNEETIKENAELCQKKIKVCDQLFAKTYQASRGNILSRKDTIVIKDKIGKIKESIQEELNFYQGFYQNILLGLPINVDFNKLNLIKQKQALLTGSLKTIINVPEIPDAYCHRSPSFPSENDLQNALRYMSAPCSSALSRKTKLRFPAPEILQTQ